MIGGVRFYFLPPAVEGTPYRLQKMTQRGKWAIKSKLDHLKNHKETLDLLKYKKGIIHKHTDTHTHTPCTYPKKYITTLQKTKYQKEENYIRRL